MTKIKRSSMFILASAIMFLIAVFFLSINCSHIAYADESLSFTILTDDGYSWSLLQGDRTIAQFDGEFFNPQIQEDVASVVFKRKIDETLQSTGASDYSLNFVLPEIGYAESGNAVFEYTEKQSGFIIKGVYSPIISSNIAEALQYKSGDGEFVNYTYSSEYGGGLTFGQYVGVGEYYVRFAAYEIFTFDGVNYRVPRYSPSTVCRILKAVPEAPDVEQIEVVYGTAAKDIAVALPSLDCVWSLSDEQVDSAITDGDVRLHVREEAYTVCFDYAPRNPNYETLKGISINVKIEAKALRIRIADAYSFWGEEMTALGPYEITTPLVDGDNEAELGVSLVCENFDKNTAGAYLITARFANADYKPICVNYTSAFIDGGRYMVYSTRVECIAPDGNKFFVMLDEGFRDVTVRIELFTDDINESGFKFVCGYEFIFETDLGERVYPSDGFAVEWDGDTIAANHMRFVFEDGSAGDIIRLSQSGLSVPQGVKSISFFNDIASVALKADSREVACVVLASLCGVLGAALIVLLVVYFARRRYFV